MSRDEGFPNADIDTRKHTDPKVRALWRRLQPDEDAMNAAMVLHEAVLLASWGAGDRVSAEDAAPSWMSDLDGPAEALKSVGLLDQERRIPAHAWESWFGLAYGRRDRRREAWRDSKARFRQKSAPGVHVDSVRSPRPPTGPSYPSVPSSTEGSSSKRSGHGELTSVADIQVDPSLPWNRRVSDRKP